VRGATVSFAGWDFALPADVDLRAYDGSTVVLGIRPSDIEDAAIHPDQSLPTIDVTPEVIEELGSQVHLIFPIDAPRVASEHTRAAEEDDVENEPLVSLAESEGKSPFTAEVDPRTHARIHEQVRLTLDPERFHFFDPATAEAIPTAATARATR